VGVMARRSREERYLEDQGIPVALDGKAKRKPSPKTTWQARWKKAVNSLWAPNPLLPLDDCINRIIDSYGHFSGVVWADPEKLAKKHNFPVDDVKRVIAANLRKGGVYRRGKRNRNALYRKGNRHAKANRQDFEEKRIAELKSPLSRMLALLVTATINGPQEMGYKEISERIDLQKDAIRITRPLLRQLGFNWKDGKPGQPTIYWHTKFTPSDKLPKIPTKHLIDNLVTAYCNTSPLPDGDHEAYRKLDISEDDLPKDNLPKDNLTAYEIAKRRREAVQLLRDYRDLVCDATTLPYLPLLAQLPANRVDEYVAEICHLYIRGGGRPSRLEGWANRLKHEVEITPS
jgi:hypothetical protein